MITNQGGHHECAARTQRQAAERGRSRGHRGLWVLALTAIVLVTLMSLMVASADQIPYGATQVWSTEPAAGIITRRHHPCWGAPLIGGSNLRAGYGKPPRRHTDTRWSAISHCEGQIAYLIGHNTGPNHWRYPAISIQRNLNHQVGAHRLEESDRTDRGHGPGYANWIGGEGYGRTEGMGILTETITHYPA